MPKKPRRVAFKYGKRSGKKTSRPNVYVGETPARRAAGQEEQPDAGETTAPASPRRRASPRLRTQSPARRRRVRARDVVYTQYLSQELRKIGILTAAMLVTLGVLAVVLS